MEGQTKEEVRQFKYCTIFTNSVVQIWHCGEGNVGEDGNGQ